jgi:hypothetical protein
LISSGISAYSKSFVPLIKDQKDVKNDNGQVNAVLGAACFGHFLWPSLLRKGLI